MGSLLRVGLFSVVYVLALGVQSVKSSCFSWRSAHYWHLSVVWPWGWDCMASWLLGWLRKVGVTSTCITVRVWNSHVVSIPAIWATWGKQSAVNVKRLHAVKGGPLPEEVRQHHMILDWSSHSIVKSAFCLSTVKADHCFDILKNWKCISRQVKRTRWSLVAYFCIWVLNFTHFESPQNQHLCRTQRKVEVECP